jgi:hypothetical protein
MSRVRSVAKKSHDAIKTFSRLEVGSEEKKSHYTKNIFPLAKEKFFYVSESSFVLG